MKKKLLSILAMIAIAMSSSAQLKVSSSGKVSVGTTQTSASALSVNSAGNSNYAVYINGNCKVDSGFVNATVFQPRLYPGWTSSSISNDAMEKLLSLTAQMYTQSSRNLDDVSDESLTGDEEDNGLRSNTPLSAHFAITNMFQNFPLLTNSVGGTYSVNYSELVPLLVCAYQVLAYYMANHSLSLLPDDMSSEGEEETEETSQGRPSRAMQRLAGAQLYQNTPNPFTAQTTIRFRLPENAQNAFICIFDMTGKMLKQIPVNASMNSVTINGYELSAGMYLYSLTVNGQEVDTKRMILSK